MAKILIVDDEPRIRELIHEHLQYSGYICEEAGDGSAALAQLSVWQVLAVLAVGLSYPLLEGCVAWVIVRSRLPQFTLRQGLDVGWCGTFGNVVTLGAGAVPVQTWYLHQAGLDIGPGVGLMTLQYVFHKTTVLLLSLIHI